MITVKFSFAPVQRRNAARRLAQTSRHLRFVEGVLSRWAREESWRRRPLLTVLRWPGHPSVKRLNHWHRVILAGRLNLTLVLRLASQGREGNVALVCKARPDHWSQRALRVEPATTALELTSSTRELNVLQPTSPREPTRPFLPPVRRIVVHRSRAAVDSSDTAHVPRAARESSQRVASVSNRDWTNGKQNADIPRLADEVLRAIDQRIVAERERLWKV
jgi:hypothetical protein